MSKLIVYGNCQSAAVYSVLQAIPEIAGTWDIVHHNLWAAGEELERNLADFDECSVLVRQNVRNWRTHPHHDSLPPGVQEIVFPFCYVAALWPFDGHQNGNDPGWSFGEGEQRFGFSDSLLGRLRTRFPDPEERFAHYCALDLPELPDIARYAELEEARLLREDESIGSRVGHYIVDNLRTRRLFHTITHPTPDLFFEILREIVGKIGIDVAPFGHRVLDYLAYLQVPIHPKVASVLRLQWYKPDETYNFHGQERLTFTEYYRRYIRVYG